MYTFLVCTSTRYVCVVVAEASARCLSVKFRRDSLIAPTMVCGYNDKLSGLFNVNNKGPYLWWLLLGRALSAQGLEEKPEAFPFPCLRPW